MYFHRWQFSTRVALVFVCVAPADFHGFIRWVGCSRLDAGADSRASVLIPCALSQCFLMYRFRVFFTCCATVAYIYALSLHSYEGRFGGN